uniref:Aminotransferase class I/classII large domain-containing protein n=1 Tax=Ostreococcus mediterraneus TaxID=1486918 RepID=A0A7S0KN48_9CHLO|eukprot:CAMPEP_0174580024 /NCGR_PEP_ID=MMETSP0929-20130131/1948_1 /TAXON_ID=548131 ORGANISM="Ostreococcus mediterraneus, Strain clade-D-RCC2572" /NCGR_SAMPLE_ID=MMETSP0929 /ASSEMBLY_ACC=CAM_ASM_000573 /LENGTH=445 /DNA_ID=CAMNT_0015761435 /DNA_START=37 /DNA_END=1374 /DNA_ORIENTATION=+
MRAFSASSAQCAALNQTVSVRRTHACRARTVVNASSNVRRNPNMAQLKAGYLFPEIARIRTAHLEANPDAKIISLGIGDTTEPIPQAIVDGMVAGAAALGTKAGYSAKGGYGAEAGQMELRAGLAEKFYAGTPIEKTDVFVSDGSKCDISRMLQMFGTGRKIAVQDPSYPAYVDSSVIMGNSTGFDDATKQYQNITYMPCNADNDFFPDLSKAKNSELIFFCSPNNPTGAAATRAQLTQLVNQALETGSFIIYDAAYSAFIGNDDCPKTIYEIPGAEKCCIETCSFSKYAGFTGLRLGWTVFPEALKFSDGSSVRQDWNRMMGTGFNGASNVAQAAGLACLTDAGMKGMKDMVAFYKENAAILKSTWEEMGYNVYGGTDAPYVWVSFEGRDSWEVFTEILQKTDIVVTPGAGFGPAGNGYVRCSAFGSRENINEAARRLKEKFSK